MRVGISTASLFMKQQNDEAVALLNEWGMPTSEVFLSTFSEYNRAYGELIAQKKGQLHVNSVHTLTEQFEPQLYSISDKVTADAFSWLKGVMEAAQALGAKHYTFHGVGRVKRKGNYDNFDRLCPRTRQIFNFCARYGVTLAYENVEWATYNRPGVFTRLREQCPQLKGVLDIKQAYISGYAYRDYIADMGTSLAYVHFCDLDKNGNTCLAGKGVFNIEEMLKTLADYGFDGDILLEQYAKDFTELKELRKSYLYLSEKIYKFGLGKMKKPKI